jgi:nifR3 family TIM-barrel protein
MRPEPVEGPPAGLRHARPASLNIGTVTVDPPVVLAPMAGITNAAFRQLCREQLESRPAVLRRSERTRFSSASDDEVGGFERDSRERSEQSDICAGLYVCEMITSRGLVERDRKTLRMLQFDPGERVRSVQLYGVDPAIMARAAEILCNEYGVDHVDLNFGCPVPKVTRKGGGAALPYKRERLRMILTATVRAAARYGVPVTIKTRIGIDRDHQTCLDAGRIAEESGCAAIALHGRTALQAYAGQADWDAIRALKAHVSIPVLGNGDIWEAADVQRMIRQTGVDGVVIGRGCLGRPWLFRDLADGFAGRQSRTLPNLGEVMGMLRRHAELLVALSDELHGLSDLRKHMAWYFKGFPVGGELRHRLSMVSSLAELDGLLSQLDPSVPFPTSELGSPRGRQGGPRATVALPDGWLADTSGRDLDLAAAELGISGG